MQWTYCPVPANFTICGLAPPLSEKANEAVRVPTAVGWNSRLTVQLAPATISGGHESNEIRKSAAFVPVTETLLMCNVVLPRLVSVTDRAELVVPTVCAAKVRLVGDTLTIVPVPVMFTI